MSYRQRGSKVALIAIVILIVVFLLATVSAAFAQEVIVVQPTEAQEWMRTLRDLFLLIATGVLIPALVQWLRAKGYNIQEAHQKTLHSALNTAADLVFDPMLPAEERRRRGLAYVRESATQAIAYFKADDDHLYKMLEAYLKRREQQPVSLGDSSQIDDLFIRNHRQP